MVRKKIFRHGCPAGHPQTLYGPYGRAFRPPTYPPPGPWGYSVSRLSLRLLVSSMRCCSSSCAPAVLVQSPRTPWGGAILPPMLDPQRGSLLCALTLAHILCWSFYRHPKACPPSLLHLTRKRALYGLRVLQSLRLEDSRPRATHGPAAAAAAAATAPVAATPWGLAFSTPSSPLRDDDWSRAN